MEKSLGFIAFDLDGVLSSQICRDKYIHHSLDCTDDVDVNNTNRFNDIIKYAKENDIPVIVNTARPKKWFGAIPKGIQDELNNYDVCIQPHSHDPDYTKEMVAENKVLCMDRFMKMNNDRPGLLLDDDKTNCNYVNDTKTHKCIQVLGNGISSVDINEIKNEFK